MGQFFLLSLGFVMMSLHIKQAVRAYYARLTPGLAVTFHENDLRSADCLIVCVDGRDVGHVFGKGIAR